MRGRLCIPIFCKTLNIIYGPWNCMFSINKVSHRNRGDTLYYNVIQRRFGVGNQKMENVYKRIILIMDAN